MILVIKLDRIGCKNNPVFRIISSYKHSFSGKSFRKLGNLFPRKDSDKLKLNYDLFFDLLSKGAKTTKKLYYYIYSDVKRKLEEKVFSGKVEEMAKDYILSSRKLIK